MREEVDVSWSEDEAGAELEWIFSQFVLLMAGGAGSFSRLEFSLLRR